MRTGKRTVENYNIMQTSLKLIRSLNLAIDTLFSLLPVMGGKTNDFVQNFDLSVLSVHAHWKFWNLLHPRHTKRYSIEINILVYVNFTWKNQLFHSYLYFNSKRGRVYAIIKSFDKCICMHLCQIIRMLNTETVVTWYLLQVKWIIL